MFPSLTRRTFFGTAAVALGSAAGAWGQGAGKKLLVLAGRPSHGPLEHEFNAGALLLKKCMERVPGLEVSFHRNGWPENERAFQGIHGIFLYADGGNGHPFVQQSRLEVVGDLMRRGVGLLCAHYAVEVPKDRAGKQFQEWLGGYYEHQWSCNPMWTPEFKQFPDHPITRGVKPFAARDEWYFNMRFRPENKGVVPILAAAPPDATRDGPYVYPKGPYPHIQAAKGQVESMMWAVERPDGGRGVGFTGGHYHRNWSDDNFRKVVLNAALWICHAEVPPGGVESSVSDEDMKANLDPKQPRK